MLTAYTSQPMRAVVHDRYGAPVDRCDSLEEVVDATRYVETEQKAGNVVLTLG